MPAPTPLSSYRSWIGIAKISLDGVVGTGGVVATAVSLPVSGGVTTGISTADSIMFLDGANSEVVTVTAAPSGGAVPISATTYAHPANCYFFVQATSGFGPVDFLPVTDFSAADKYDQLYDESFRGVPADKAGVSQGMRSAEWTINGNVFGDTFGFLLGAFWGSEDYTAGTPNSHLFALDCQGNGQPSRYALYSFDVVNCRVVVGRLSELTLKYDPKALLSYTSKWLARASGVMPTTPTPSFSAVPPAASWRTSVSFAGTAVSTPKSIDITMSRLQSENIGTINGTQDPYDSFVGEASVSIKTMVVKPDDVMLNRYIGGTVFASLFSFSQGTGATQIQLNFQASQCNIDTDEPKPGKNYITEDVAMSTIFNSTDANVAGGGQSPARVTLDNAIGSGVFA